MQPSSPFSILSVFFLIAVFNLAASAHLLAQRFADGL
jgi:hypothetical protein